MGTVQKFYTVKSKAARTDFKDVLRVTLPYALMSSHGLQSEDLCTLRTEDGETSYLAIAWPEKRTDNSIMMTKSYQTLHGLSDKHKLSIQRSEDQIQDAISIELITEPDYSIPAEDIPHWAWLMEDPLYIAEMLTPGMEFQKYDRRRKHPKFKIQSINSSRGSGIFRFVESTQVTIVEASETANTGSDRGLRINEDGLGGLHQQVRKINHLLGWYSQAQKVESMRPVLKRVGRGGLLLHGSTGTGKTLLLQRIGEAGWRKTFAINLMTTKSQEIKKVFGDARKASPSMIAIENLEILSKDSESPTALNIIAVLDEEFKLSIHSGVLVVGTTADLRKVNPTFRNSRALRHEIELPVPDTKDRREILRIISGFSPSDPAALLDDLAERTHGYVGRDLDKLVTLAHDIAEERLYIHEEQEQSTATTVDPPPSPASTEVQQADYDAALLLIRPSSMSDIFITTPKTRWSEIGGSQQVKSALRKAVEWPLRHPDVVTRLMTHPIKGMLLYGPPGCSKTLCAKALATESGLNFLVVKGGELVNMYVGETERAVREVFRKARAAAPSILFFDEIDALASGRGDARASGLHVVTTLLNELDGIEPLKGVFVLAATNVPQNLDAALLRPGRFDQLLFVGPPDKAGRKEIINIELAKVEAAEDVDREWLAEETDGYTGAELVSVCAQAGTEAVEDQFENPDRRVQLEMKHLKKALGLVTRQANDNFMAGIEIWEKSIELSRQ